MLTSILSLVLGIYTASLYYGQAAALAQRYLATSPTVSAIVGYAAVFIAVFLLIEMAGQPAGPTNPHRALELAGPARRCSCRCGYWRGTGGVSRRRNDGGFTGRIADPGQIRVGAASRGL